MKIYRLFLLLVIGFIANVNAKEIDYIYMNVNTDILGSVHIKEAIITDEDKISIPIIFKPYTKKQTKTNIENTTFYNARGVSVKCAKSLKTKKNGFEILDNSCESDKDYKVTTKKDRKIVSISKSKKSDNVYIIDYFIDQVLVVHKDISELYFPFINDYDYDIKNAKIQVVFSGYTKTFKYYSHSKGQGNISPIKNKEKNLYKGVIINLKDIPSKSSTDVRLLFNKNLTGISEKILNDSGQKSLDRIVKIEQKRTNEAKKINRIRKIKRITMIVFIVFYVLLTISIIVFFIKFKFNKIILFFYFALGLLIILIYKGL